MDINESGFGFGAEHKHERWEVIYYFLGEGEISVGNRRFDFNRNSILLVPPGEKHREYSSTGFCNISFQFRDRGFCLKKTVMLKDDMDMTFLKVLKQMYKEFIFYRDGAEGITDCFFEILYNYMLIGAGDAEKRGEITECILNDILTNFSDPEYKVESSMEKVNMSKSAAREIFAKETGKTPKQYLVCKRMEYAKELLVREWEGGVSVKDIAFRCGFKDQYYFTQVFKAHFGMSPRKWAMLWRKVEMIE